MTLALSPRVSVSVAEPARAILTVDTETGPLRIRLDAGQSRLTLGLLLGQRDRPMDVSARPTAIIRALSSPLGGTEADLDAVTAWLASFCAEHGLRSHPDDDLARRLTGACFPLLGHLYDLGSGTLDEVPRWAAPALAEPSPRRAAVAVLGPTPSRSLIAALAASLLPPGGQTPPRLHPMALAIMGSGVLAADALTNVLHAATHDEQPDVATWPSVDEIVRFCLLAPMLGQVRVRRLLMDAARLAEGPRLLARTAVLYTGLPVGLQDTLPLGLAALHERCRALTPIDPRPQVTARTPPAARVSRAQPATRATQRVPRVVAPRHALRAPAVERVVPHPGWAFSYPPRVARLHGRLIGPTLRLVLPRTGHELTQWGQLLHNCLGTFPAAVTAGRSLLVGVERDDVLTYCVEVALASRTVRQFHGPYNRAVPGATVAMVCSVLLAERLVDPSAPANRPWLQVARSFAPSASATDTQRPDEHHR